MVDVTRVSNAASLLADPLRVSLIDALRAGPLSVSELTARLGAPQPRVSAHLALLRQAGWVEAGREGRQRRYQLSAPDVMHAVEALDAASHQQPYRQKRRSHAYRKPKPDEPMRHARTCYDHLAGVAGVELCDALLRLGWIEPLMEQPGRFQPSYTLTDRGRQQLLARDVALPEAGRGRRRFAYACPDWTEDRPHVGGALGAALLDALVIAGIVRREASGRTVSVYGDISSWCGGEPV
jgi:DNA-binding transcriptional ArsR family regulator